MLRLAHHWRGHHERDAELCIGSKRKWRTATNLFRSPHQQAPSPLVSQFRIPASGFSEPLPPPEMLKGHGQVLSGAAPTDSVLAGDSGRPRWRGVLFRDHIQPAAEKAGIGRIGWHTFRHSFSTLIHDMGTDLAVQKELLRHADVKTTMNIYPWAMAPAKRKAIRKLTKKLLEA